jgi:ribosomal protein L40E
LNPGKLRDPPICRECGATNDAVASECWLCHRRDWRFDVASPAAKPASSPGGDPPGRRIAVAIVVGAIAIIGLGMLLDIWPHSELPVLVFALLVIPLGLTLWAWASRRSHQGRSMTYQELAAGGSTIAAGVILVTWLVRAAGSGSIGIIAAILGVLAIPAGLYTRTQARQRRREGRPMTVLQVTASMIFVTVLLPPLLLISMVIALLLICRAAGPFVRF